MAANKLFCFPRLGKTVMVMGYEPFALSRLLRLGISEEELFRGFQQRPQIPYFFDTKWRLYHPDIWLPAQNRLIEVKSEFTMQIQQDKNLAKLSATQNRGYKAEIQIFDRWGDLRRIIS